MGNSCDALSVAICISKAYDRQSNLSDLSWSKQVDKPVPAHSNYTTQSASKSARSGREFINEQRWTSGDVRFRAAGLSFAAEEGLKYACKRHCASGLK